MKIDLIDDRTGHPAGSIDVPPDVMHAARTVYSWLAMYPGAEICGVRLGGRGDLTPRHMDSAPKDGSVILVFPAAGARITTRWHFANWTKRPRPHPQAHVRNEGWHFVGRPQFLYGDEDFSGWFPAPTAMKP